MQGDFDRVTFDADDHFANVLIQQGRLLLSADVNEQSAIHHHFLRTLIVDLKGRRWRASGGFKITFGSAEEFKITKGRYYIDGIPCENPKACKIEDQPFKPVPEGKDWQEVIVGENIFAFYLDCWERHVTWINYPRLRETALGGPDTATRLQIAWQVRPLTKPILLTQLSLLRSALRLRQEAGLLGDDQGELDSLINKMEGMSEEALDCKNVNTVLDLLDKAPPRLIADAKRDADNNNDPCAIAPDAQYRGRENQLYRVEIHKPGLAKETGGATFKWSREAGSVVFRVLDVDSADKKDGRIQVVLESLGHDRRTGLCVNDWVELMDTDIEMRQEDAPLMQVTNIDSQRRLVTLKGRGAEHPSVKLDCQPILRRWDHQGDSSADGALLIVEKNSDDDSGWINLERGIRIRFAPGGLYRTGDYWLIPARVATGDIEWPIVGASRRALEPHGVRHHRAALAIVGKVTGGSWEVDDKQC